MTRERRRYLWYLATSGLLRLKQVLVDVLKPHLEFCHQAFLYNLAISIGVSSAAEIDSSEPTWIQDIDVNKRFLCQIHDTYDIKACEKGCPNACRQHLLTEIKCLHRQQKPIWKNTQVNGYATIGNSQSVFYQ